MTNNQLQQFADGLIKQYRYEIVRDGDWWHGTDEYSFNIHCPDDDGWFRINVYKVDPVTGMDNCDHWIDLDPVHLGDHNPDCIIQMRHDLIKLGYAIPASKTFSNYDTLDDRLFVTAEELEGATFGDDPADPDDHPFCFLQLKDGRSLYFVGADLDFIYKLKIVQTE